MMHLEKLMFNKKCRKSGMFVSEIICRVRGKKTFGYLTGV